MDEGACRAERDGAPPRGSVPLARLTRRRDFLAAAEGRRFHTPRMTVQARRRADESGRGIEAEAGPAPGVLRVGFTVTKRVGHATERNRIRRRLRVALPLALPLALPAPAPPSASLDASPVAPSAAGEAADRPLDAAPPRPDMPGGPDAAGPVPAGRSSLEAEALAERVASALAALDVVVVARREVLAAPFPILVEDLAKALALLARPRAPGGSRDRRGARSAAPKSGPRPGPTPQPTPRSDAPPR